MRCIGCQADFTKIESTLDPVNPLPTHAYMLSSPACWATYGQILAAEYQDYNNKHLHRLTVDTYAVQHPGIDIPAARRSVAIHLSRLYLLIECGWPMEQANRAMVKISADKDQRPWLEPPSMLGTVSVINVLGASTSEDHDHRIQRWARSVWQAWQPHHSTVGAWCVNLCP